MVSSARVLILLFVQHKMQPTTLIVIFCLALLVSTVKPTKTTALSIWNKGVRALSLYEAGSPLEAPLVLGEVSSCPFETDLERHLQLWELVSLELEPIVLETAENQDWFDYNGVQIEMHLNPLYLKYHTHELLHSVQKHCFSISQFDAWGRELTTAKYFLIGLAKHLPELDLLLSLVVEGIISNMESLENHRATFKKHIASSRINYNTVVVWSDKTPCDKDTKAIASYANQ